MTNTPQTAEEWKNKGNEFFEKEDYQSALDCYNKAVEMAPKDFFANFSKAKANYQSKNFIKAIKDYIICGWLFIAAFSEYRVYPLFKIIFDIGASIIKNRNKSCELCENVKYLRRTEYDYLTHGIYDFENSEKQFKIYAKTRIKPKTAEEYNERGDAFCEFTFYKKAINDYSKALKLDKNNPLYLKNRANACSASNKYREAHKDLDKAIEINSKYAEAYSSKAHIFYLQEKYDKAIEYYSKALELDISYEYKDHDYSSRANCYEKLGEYGKAIDDHSKFIQLHPEYTQPYFDRGFDYLKTEQYTEAIEDFNKYFELYPESQNAYYERGTAYFNIKNYEKAVEDYTKAIEFDPKNPDLYLKRGFAYAELKELDKTVDDFKKAYEYKADLGYNWRHIYVYLSAAYFEKGDYQNAILNLNEVIKNLKHLNIKKYEPYAALAEAYQHLNQPDKAAEYLKKAKELGYVEEGTTNDNNNKHTK